MGEKLLIHTHTHTHTQTQTQTHTHRHTHTSVQLVRNSLGQPGYFMGHMRHVVFVHSPARHIRMLLIYIIYNHSVFKPFTWDFFFKFLV